jgi:pre-mRNA-splicing helicase BRR2
MMNTISSPLLSFFLLVCILCAGFTASSFSPRDMLSSPRAGPAIPNPNGMLAVRTQTTYSFETDSRTGGIYLLPITSPTAPVLRNVINDPNASNPVWLDDRTIAYIYTQSGESSLRTFDIESLEDRELEAFPGSIGDLKVFRIGSSSIRFAFSARTTPQGDIVPAKETEPPGVLVYDKLWARHWDEWITSNQNSIFSGTLRPQDGSYTISERPRNMLHGIERHPQLESPIPPFGDSQDYSISETYLAFVTKDPHINPATNTAALVYTIPFDDTRRLERVTKGPGACSSPAWSPDGEWLAYLEMRIRGYESDRTS